MSLKYLLVVAVAILSTMGSCVEKTLPSRGTLDEFMAEFLAAVADHDEEKLILLAGPHQATGGSMSKDGKLAADVRVVLFEGDTIRRNIPGGRSIAEILQLGEIVPYVAWDEISSALVMFLPSRELHRLEDPNFYSDEWMKTYFACPFQVVDGEWRFGPGNFCYASTDGPFPGDIG